MNVYTCNNFKGHYPVGSAAVIVAENYREAMVLLERELLKRGLNLSGSETLTKVSLKSKHVNILVDGDY